MIRNGLQLINSQNRDAILFVTNRDIDMYFWKISRKNTDYDFVTKQFFFFFFNVT